MLETKGGEVWFHLFCPSVHHCLFILLDCNQSLFPFTLNLNVHMVICQNLWVCVLYPNQYDRLLSAKLPLCFKCLFLYLPFLCLHDYVLYFCLHICNLLNIGLTIPNLFCLKNVSDRGIDRLWPGSAPCQHQLSCHQPPRFSAQMWLSFLKCLMPALCFCLLVSWLLLTRNHLLKVDPYCGKLKRGKTKKPIFLNK